MLFRSLLVRSQVRQAERVARGLAPTPIKVTLTERVDLDATADFFRQTNVLTAVGTGGSGQDAQVALLVNWQVGDGRRGGKPRNYIPGVLDSVVADSARLDSTFVSTVSASINTWLTTIAGETPNFALVDMSFRDAKAWRTNAVPFPIHGGNLNEVVATQRRRVDRLRI